MDGSTKIDLCTAAEYKIGKTTYRVTPHYTESGDLLQSTIARLLKCELENVLCGGLTPLDEQCIMPP